MTTYCRAKFISANDIQIWEAEVGKTPIHGMVLKLPRGGRIGTHKHFRGQIMAANVGSVMINANGVHNIIGGNKCLWIPEDTAHNAVALTQTVLYNLQILKEFSGNFPRECSVITVSTLFNMLLSSVIKGGDWDIYKNIKAKKIIELLPFESRVDINDAVSFNLPHDPRIRKICETLLQNSADNRSLADWSLTVGGCSRTLERSFRRQTSLTFSEWRRGVRIQDAIVRLRRGHSVTAVALDVGYSDVGAFITMFRRVTGVTPRQFIEGKKGN